MGESNDLLTPSGFGEDAPGRASADEATGARIRRVNKHVLREDDVEVGWSSLAGLARQSDG